MFVFADSFHCSEMQNDPGLLHDVYHSDIFVAKLSGIPCI